MPHEADRGWRKSWIKDNGAATKSWCVAVEGIISSGIVDQGSYDMVTVLKEQLRRAKKDRDVKAVILKVDSRREVLAADDMAKAIRNFEEESHKPVVVSMAALLLPAATMSRRPANGS